MPRLVFALVYTFWLNLFIPFASYAEDTVFKNVPLTGKRLVINPGTVCGSKEVSEVLRFVPLGENKIINGSFELGLGPFFVFPGYRVVENQYDSASMTAYKNPPPLPKVVDDEKHSGAKCLRLEARGSHQIPLFYITPPNLLNTTTKTTHYFSFWAKASRKVSMMVFRPRGTLNGRYIIGTEWTKVSGHFTLVPSDSATLTWRAPPLRFSFQPGKAEIGKPGKPLIVWVDDIKWSFDKPAKEQASGPVEAIFLPITRQGYVLSGKQYILSWRVKSAVDKTVKTVLYIRDVSRDSETRKLPEKELSLSAGAVVTGKSVPLALKKGHYLALLAVRDAESGKLLAVARQRFSVLCNLLELPRTVDFNTGAMYYFRPPYAYCARGPWSLDEQYKLTALCGGFVIRDLHTWENVEPEEGKYDWGKLDLAMAAAHKYRIGFMHEMPAMPFGVTAADYKRYKGGFYGKGLWRLKRGELLGERRRVADNTWVPSFKNTTFWFAPLDAQIKFIRAYFKRYRGKGVNSIEYMNEVCAMTSPKYYIEKVMKPLYHVFKECAPELPVLTNNTGNAGIKYLKDVVDLGGAKYMDGLTYHPYPHPDLARGSLENVRMYRKAADEWIGKKFLLGNTEVMTLSPISSMERTLSDWVGGGRWSIGEHWRDLFAIEHSAEYAWFNTGPMAPSLKAVYLNGLNYVLAGARLLGSVQSFNDVIVGFFEKDIPSLNRKEYVVVLDAAWKKNRSALLENVDLSKVKDIVAYDETGEPCAPFMVLDDESAVLVPHRTLYLASSSRALVDAFSNVRRRWVFDAGFKLYDISPMDVSREVAARIYYGDAWFDNLCVLGEWKVSTGDLPDELTEATSILKADPISGNIKVGGIDGGAVKRLTGAVYSHTSREYDLRYSTLDVKSISLLVNGKRILSDAKPKEGTLGETWNDTRVQLKAGRNIIDIHVVPKSRYALVRVALRIPPVETQCTAPFLVSSAISRLRSPGVELELQNIVYLSHSVPKSLFDRNLSTKCSFRLARGRNAKGPSILVFAMADHRPHVVDGYLLAPDRSPTGWCFEGSNDKMNWTLLDEKKNFKSKKRIKVRRVLDNKTPYRYYRLVLTEAPPVISFHEIDLYYHPSSE